MSGSKRKKVKDVSATGESSYKNVSEVRELKMPDGSSVRPLELRPLEEARNEIDQVFRVGSISCLITHHR